MPASISIKVNADPVHRFLLRDVPGAVERATARGLNKGILQVRTVAIKQIRQERSLKARDVRATMSTNRAHRKHLSATLTSTGRPIALKQYGARVVGKRGRGHKKGNHPVQVQIIKGRKRMVRGGFLGPNGHVYRRLGKPRLPIKKLFGPSIPSAMAKRKVDRAMRSLAESKVPGLIEHELRRELGRA